MRTRRSRTPGQVATGLGAIGIVTAVGLAGTATSAGAHAPADAGGSPPPVTGSVPQVPRERPGQQTYSVRAGDTVSGIAARFHTTVAAISRANDLGPRALIRIGQVLTIPASVGTTSPTSTTAGSSSGGPASTSSGATTTYTVRTGDTLSGIAAQHGTTVARITSLNHLSSTVIQPGQRLVLSRSPASAATSSSGQASASSSSHTARYTVRSGDTVSGIAARHGTTVAAIIRANDLGPTALIRIGQVLAIPTGGGTTSSGTSTSTSGSSTTGTTTYTVRSGDTLSGIAARHGTTVDRITALNDLSSTVIHPGQRLRVAGSTSSGSSSPGTTSGSSSSGSSTGSTTSYTVRSGDTLSGIASRHGTTVAALTASNDLASTVIQPGQTLRVPAQLVPSTFLHYTYPADVVAAANANKHTLLQSDLPSAAQMQQIIRTTAIEMGVDPALALAIAHQESGFSASAVSPANAIGAMQVIPSSGEWASDMVGRDLDLLDPHDNAVAGVAILRWLTRNAADLPSAIAGYYQGLASVRSNGMYADTRRYVANIQTLMTRYA